MNQDLIHRIEITIQKAIVDSNDKEESSTIFDYFLEECENYYKSPSHSIYELKQKQSTKIKGDIFEHFCLLYFKKIYGLQEIWLLQDLPENILQTLGLKRNDLGIDLIGIDYKLRYYAIQAKYRNRKNMYKKYRGLTWKQLSTFYALVYRTGPYYKHVVITTCDYVRHIGGRKTSQDQSICYTRLKNILKEKWMELANYGTGHKLVNYIADKTNDKNEQEKTTKKEIIIIRKKNSNPSLERLRELRVKNYEKI